MIKLILTISLFFSLFGKCESLILKSENAKNQEEAFRLFEKKEVMQIVKCDSVVLLDFTSKKVIGGGGNTFNRLLLTQKNTHPKPLAHLPWVYVSFVKEGHVVTSCWITENGYWGIVREGTSWTIGKNKKILNLVKKNCR